MLVIETLELCVIRTGNLILDRINISLRKNEILALVGPSGCGKTTFLKSLMGLIEPKSGKIIIRKGLSKSMMFQQNLLQPWLSVEDLVRLPGKILGKSIDSNKWLEMVGLNEWANKYPWELSGGMKRRVSLARSLSTYPDILLLDEPFYGIDEITKEKLYQEFSLAIEKSNSSVIFVTHNVNEAIFLADRIIAITERPASIKGEIIVKLERPRQNNIFLKQNFLDIAKDLRIILNRKEERL